MKYLRFGINKIRVLVGPFYYQNIQLWII